MNFRNVLLPIIFIFSFNVFANTSLKIIAVGDAQVEPVGIGIFVDKGVNENVKIQGILKNDFAFYRKYFVPKILPDLTPGTIKLQNISYYFSLTRNVSNVSVKLIDVSSSEELFSKEYPESEKFEREFAHTISNDVYTSLTNKESIFLSKIVFVSNKGSTRRSPIKELYVMDFDGFNPVKLTNHKSNVVGPSISHSKDKVLYSIYKGVGHKRNLNLYLLDLKTKETKLMSSERGMNSGAVFLPGDEKIVFTISLSGNTEIFEMDLKSRKKRRITNNFSVDVDPSVNKDGTLMAFLSGRAGKAMIYTLDPTGMEKSVKRISYVGDFNASPRFSPDGSEIVFSSWMDNRFDLFRIGANGVGLSRLTKNFGSNEDPTYSNDGQFIAFSSQKVINLRKAVHDIYIMDRDGEILGKITSDLGNCLSPRWSK